MKKTGVLFAILFTELIVLRALMALPNYGESRGSALAAGQAARGSDNQIEWRSFLANEGVTDRDIVADRLVSSQEVGGSNSDRANSLRIM